MKKIITGISVEEQQRKAKLILDEVVIPR